jgi:hypothetical protein
MGGPCQVTQISCFFTGLHTAPTARIAAVRVHENEKQEWKEDGHKVSIHVLPEIVDMAEMFSRENKALVLTAQDEHNYRLIV